MATRLSVITTRGGDQGTTGLGDGARIDKDAPRIGALGDVDELNSVIGLLRAEALPPDIDRLFARIQNDLFDLGAELCIPGHTAVSSAQVVFLEEALTQYNAQLGSLQEFILPGGTRAAALAHFVRTVCRRAERSVVAMNKVESAGGNIDADADTDAEGQALRYLNRLSDLCFVLARALNRADGHGDVLWTRSEPQD